MIQRIQTVYLFLVALLMVVAMCMPVGTFQADGGVTCLTNFAITYPGGDVSHSSCFLLLLLLAVAVVSGVAIFLYKKRMLQVRLAVWASLLLVAYYVGVVFLVVKDGDACGRFTPGWSVCLPFVALVLNWLAIRAIRKDEKLVRSYDTIR